MLVNITQQHIDKGKTGNSTECPTALAVQEKIGFKVRVHVGLTFIFFVFDDQYTYDAPQPQELLQWVRRYDLREKVEPLQFEIAIPDEIKPHTLGA